MVCSCLFIICSVIDAISVERSGDCDDRFGVVER